MFAGSMMVTIKKAEPQKPDRFVSGANFGVPSMSFYRKPRRKELELAWAGEFVEALTRQHGMKYVVAGRAPEPGDVLLSSDRESDIHLQIAEAVDQQRVKAQRARQLYGETTWASDTAELLRVFSGVKVAFNDAGRILRFPTAGSETCRNAAAELSLFLRWFEDSVRCLPVSVPGAERSGDTHFCLPKSRLELWVRATRYAPFGDGVPPQWLWCGPPGCIGDPPEPEYIRLSIQSKLAKSYAKISAPFWLLVYTVDCQFSVAEEANIQADLAATRHPFHRIFVLHQNKARQVFPPVEDSGTAPPKTRGWTILAHEGWPRLDDERWATVGQ